MLHAFGTAFGTAPPVDASGHARDNPHDISDQIICSLIRKNRFDVPLLQFHQHNDGIAAKARPAIPMLHNDRPDAGISQQREKRRAAVMPAESTFCHFFCDLIAAYSSVIAQTLDLSFQVSALIS